MTKRNPCKYRVEKLNQNGYLIKEWTRGYIQERNNKEQMYERNRLRYKNLSDEDKEAYKAKKREYYHEKGKKAREEKKKMKDIFLID